MIKDVEENVVKPETKSKDEIQQVQQVQDEVQQEKEFFKKLLTGNLLFVILLIAVILLGVYIRTLPMADHNGHPGLWDITTNTWTLGPDLDPFLFLRYAKIIEANGSLPVIDAMRYVPLGYDTRGETILLPQMIVWTHHALERIGGIGNQPDNTTINYAAVIFPVIAFVFIALFFFLFVRELFLRNGRTSANIIAIVSTLFLTVAPMFLARTIAGIPEKESIGFAFMFCAFWLFIKAWNIKDEIWQVGHGLMYKGRIMLMVYALLSGIATALLGLVWGGVIYVYVTIALAMLCAIILNKMDEKYTDVYLIWFFSSLLLLFNLTERFSLKGFLSSLDTGLAFFVSVCLIVYWTIKVVYSKIGRVYPNKIPLNILCIPLAVVIGILGMAAYLGPSAAWNKVLDVNRMLFNPAGAGRWVSTVAENAQPYFVSWFGSFGAYSFALIFIGAILLFMYALRHLRRWDKLALTSMFALALCGIMLSRYSPSSVFNGTNMISKAFFILPMLLFGGYLVYLFNKYHKQNNNAFEKIEFEYIFLLILFAICLFTARSAVRLIMVINVIAPILMVYMCINLFERYKLSSGTEKAKIEMTKLTKPLLLCMIVLAIFMMGMAAWGNYNVIKGQAYNAVPYYYTFQWQQAMNWVRTSTPADAVFNFWWDYGFWVQSIGERASITDGGNSITWWNYLTGRYMLTGDNQLDALTFVHAHNVSYFLIDSTDLTKYGAFSQIGSDANLDRLSFGPVQFTSTKNDIQEKRSTIARAYRASGGYVDEDIFFNNTQIFSGVSYIIGMVVEVNTSTGLPLQPIAIYYNQGMQVRVPLRYIYDGKTFIDFGEGSGIEACFYVVDNANAISGGGAGAGIDRGGAGLYISPRIMRTFLGQVYLLNDPFNNFPAFTLAHSEPDFILSYFNSQLAAGGQAPLTEFAEYQGIKGPIKIWKINYYGNETVMKDSLLREPPDYITWTF